MFQSPLPKIPASWQLISFSLLAGAALNWTYRRLRLSEGWPKPALYPDRSSEWLGI